MCVKNCLTKRGPVREKGQSHVLDYQKSTTTWVSPISRAFYPHSASTQEAWEGSGHSLQSITVQFRPGSWLQHNEVIICQEQEQELELHKKI